MELMHFDPFSVWRDFDVRLGTGRTRRGWLPSVDVFDRENALVIRMDIAGVSPDDVDVTIEDRTLTIAGPRSLDTEGDDPGFHRREISTGAFKRTLVLPDGLDAGEISATATNGILEVSVPRRPEVLPRKVQIDVTG